MTIMKSKNVGYGLFVDQPEKEFIVEVTVNCAESCINGCVLAINAPMWSIKRQLQSS
jgi:hypothetical protein